MAECSLARCSQEKRFIRKELQRWSRNILLVVGFERIAEELMGKQRWKNVLFPLDDTDLAPTDWVQDDVCYFCQSKKSPPFDPASGIIPIKNEYCSLHNENDGEDSSDQNTILGSSDPLKDQPLDLSIHSTRKPDQQHPNLSCNGNHVGGGPSDDGEGSDSGVSGSNNFIKVPHVPVKSGSKRRFDPNGKKSYTEEELKAALRDIQSGKLGTRRAAVIYGIPRSTLRNKVYKMASDKREQIQRHQHPKLKKNSREGTETLASSVIKDNEEENKNSLNISASESLRRLLKQTITSKQQKESTGTKTSALENNIPDSLPEEEDQANEGGDKVKKPWPPLKGDSNNTADAFNSSSKIDYNQSISPLLTQVLANIQHLALANGAADVNDLRDLVAEEVCNTCSSFPLLPELIRRLAEERFELERDKVIKRRLEDDFMDNNPIEDIAESRNEIPNICSSGSMALSNVILKIPSYKPTKLCSVGSVAKVNDSVLTMPTKINLTLPPHHSTRPSTASAESDAPASSQNSSGNNKGITVSLKELIARSINQRLGNPTAVLEAGVLFTDCPSQGDKAPDKWLSNEKKLLNEEVLDLVKESGSVMKPVEMITTTSPLSTVPAAAPLSDCGSNQHHKSEKRRRPKRGRYRNYDTDNLAQAVRAVQKGEMSVHRAGTYFGVPHSTLEYKVKERHLLRPKKRKNSASSKSFKNNQRVVYQKPYYLRAGSKSGLMTEHNGPSLSGLSPNGLSSSQAEDDELEDDENREKDFDKGMMVNGSSHNSTRELNHYNTGASNLLPNPLTLWQNMPFFPLDLGLAQVATNGFFASQMMKKLQENVRLQEENALKKNNSTTNNYNSESQKRQIPEASLGLGLGSNMGILETLIKSTLEKSIPKLKESGVNNVNADIPSFNLESSLANAPLTTCKESLRKKV